MDLDRRKNLEYPCLQIESVACARSTFQQFYDHKHDVAFHCNMVPIFDVIYKFVRQMRLRSIFVRRNLHTNQGKNALTI